MCVCVLVKHEWEFLQFTENISMHLIMCAERHIPTTMHAILTDSESHYSTRHWSHRHIEMRTIELNRWK